ncbi:MAG: DNA polymerase III subunit beta [Gammaproteobacteria bacterium]
MNIKGTREQFFNCLQKVSSTAPGGSVNPILSNVLLRAGGDSVDIVATDQETQIKAPCEVKANKKFNAVVSAKKFQGILQRLESDKQVSFDYHEGKGADKNAYINIAAGKTRYKLFPLDPSDFPLLDEKSNFKPLFKIPANELLRTLKKVSYATAVNSHRLNLNGVLLEGSISGFRAVATDGHRMAVQTVLNKAEKKGSGEAQYILPRKSVNELVRNLPAEEENEVEVKVCDRDIKFCAPSFELISRTITESFPDYKSVIPRNNDKTVLLERKPFLLCLQQVSVISEQQGSTTVVINFGKNLAKMECTNSDNEVATGEIPVKYEGEAVEIGFNADFLAQMLSAVEDSAFEMKILDPSSSVLIKPAEDKKPDFQYIVMPIRL